MGASLSDQLARLDIDTREGEARGPRGGDLNNSIQPAARRAPLTAETIGNLPSLHRFTKAETAVPGCRNEQPWHRMAAFMMLAGKSNKDIAAAAGVVPQSVANLKGQRWFQELLAVIANETGQNIMGVVQGEALASVETLVSIRDSAEKDSDRLKAAQILMEHAVGKPTQRVESTVSTRTLDPKAEREELLSELQALLQPSKS